MSHVCTGTAVPMLQLARGSLPIPHPLNPLSCTSNKSIRLQPNLFFQRIHSSRYTGRILIRLHRSSWESFDQDYNLPKKRLHIQTWVSEQRFFFSSTKGDIHSTGQGNHLQFCPAFHWCRISDRTLSHLHGVALQMPHVQSDEEGAVHTTSVKTQHCLFVTRNVATCK